MYEFKKKNTYCTFFSSRILKITYQCARRLPEPQSVPLEMYKCIASQKREGKKQNQNQKKKTVQIALATRQ